MVQKISGIPVAGIDLTSPIAQYMHGMSSLVVNLLKGIADTSPSVRLIVFCTDIGVITGHV